MFMLLPPFPIKVNSNKKKKKALLLSNSSFRIVDHILEWLQHSDKTFIHRKILKLLPTV